MPFRVFSCRLPDEYIRAIADIAGEEDESQGYMIQQALYRSLDGRLPPPRRRDARVDGEKRKTQEIAP